MNNMGTMYIYPSPDVAAAMEASANRAVIIMSSGLTALCWVVLCAFFLYNFYKPLKQVDADPEGAAEPHVVEEQNEKKWWIDDYDMS
ncbi:hypothetical protein F5Y11DRAFT_345412 [Daldinia sp. FL1419]|nr:hypothetical protein F5Y11DRAFT_345412 [Daldinia sp. FL1419]